MVTIKTGAHPGSGTSSNVFIVMYGERGDTGKIPLRQAPNERGVISTRKFETAKEDAFLIRIPDIGEIRGIR